MTRSILSILFSLLEIAYAYSLKMYLGTDTDMCFNLCVVYFLFFFFSQFSTYFPGYFDGQYWLWWVFLVLGKCFVLGGRNAYLKLCRVQ